MREVLHKVTEEEHPKNAAGEPREKGWHQSQREDVVAFLGKITSALILSEFHNLYKYITSSEKSSSGSVSCSLFNVEFSKII